MNNEDVDLSHVSIYICLRGSGSAWECVVTARDESHRVEAFTKSVSDT